MKLVLNSPAFDEDIPFRSSLMARLAAKSVVTPDGCWEWSQSRTRDGYGVFVVIRNGSRIHGSAHRVAYRLFVGPIPDGFQVDHLCRNRACCNPEHLEAVTPRENIRRSEATNGRAMRLNQCARGHAYTDDNTRLRIRDGKTKRICRTCAREDRIARDLRLRSLKDSAA